MLKAHQLCAKQNGQVLRNISCAVESGEVLAVLGPTSSGKNLLGRVLAGQVLPQSGTTHINRYSLDRDPIKSRCQLGYLPNPILLEDFLTTYELLDLIASSYRLPPDDRLEKIEQLIERLGFADEAYLTLERAGTATRQKVAIAAAVIFEPSCLIADEPTQYLDFESQLRTVELLKSAARYRSTVVITDNLPLAEELADRFLLLEDGAVVATGTLKQLVKQIRPRRSNLIGVYEAIFSGRDTPRKERSGAESR